VRGREVSGPQCGQRHGREAISQRLSRLETAEHDPIHEAIAHSVAQHAQRAHFALADGASGLDLHCGNSPVRSFKDDIDLGIEIQCQLANFGYEVALYTSIEKIRQAFAKRHPGALIVDIILPEGPLEGTRFAVHTARATQRPVPTIFISVRDDWEARLEAIRGGGDVYLTKPLDMINLVEHLDRLTQQAPTEPVRVLIVDDNAALVEGYAAILDGAGMHAKVLTDPSELLDALSEFSPELVLMDLYMPNCSGVEAAKIIRQTPSYVNVPIVYLSTESELQVQLSALEVGGDDFLQKPIQRDHLVASVENRARRFRELSALVSLDGLTGLLNHIHLSLALEAELAQAKRHGGQLSYVMIDIDRFKSINDRFGHTVGDRVIKTLARLLKHRLRSSDIAGRYGGEEYALVLPDTGLDAASKLVDELRTSFSEVPFIHQGKRFTATFSAGIASSLGYSHPKDLIEAADRALYASKREGRNRITIAPP